ncbi:MAG: DUF4364 family protein [Lachnospiraceae bacterium]|nr:DUF4364 family protein [Lachnospiraceae bacterium]
MTDPKILIKLIVLYMLDKVDFSVTKAEIYDFILEREYCDYFVLTESIYELTEDGFIEASTTHSSTYLTLTDEGRSTLSFFQNRISEGIRNDINTYYEKYKGDIANRMSVITNHYRTSTGDYVADLTAREKSEDLINIKINMPTEDSAIAICDHWKERSSDIYSFILENLL